MPDCPELDPLAMPGLVDVEMLLDPQQVSLAGQYPVSMHVPQGLKKKTVEQPQLLNPPQELQPLNPPQQPHPLYPQLQQLEHPQPPQHPPQRWRQPALALPGRKARLSAAARTTVPTPHILPRLMVARSFPKVCKRTPETNTLSTNA